jgi:hypothetical protein
MKPLVIAATNHLATNHQSTNREATNHCSHESFSHYHLANNYLTSSSQPPSLKTKQKRALQCTSTYTTYHNVTILPNSMSIHVQYLHTYSILYTYKHVSKLAHKLLILEVEWFST